MRRANPTHSTLPLKLMSETIDRPYTCRVDLALPSSIYANHLKDVLSVDGELGNKIVKSFSVVGVSSEEHGGQNQNEEKELRVLRM